MSSGLPIIHFPSPVGGTPLPIDFAPSILFSVLFFLTLPVLIWRIVNPRTRTFVHVGTIAFSIEHVVFYALRAHAARSASARASKGLEGYFQMTLGAGFIAINQSLVVLTQALLVQATLGTDTAAARIPEETTSPQGDTIDAGAASDTLPPTKSDVQVLQLEAQSSSHPVGASMTDGEASPAPVVEDRPRIRAWIRRACLAAQLLSWTAITLSTLAGLGFESASEVGQPAAFVQRLRYASTAVGLFLVIGVVIGVLWAYVYLPQIPRATVLWVVTIASLLSTVAIYRLTAMRFSTTSLLSTGPGSLNSPDAKAVFYALHVGLEFLAIAIVQSLDVRRLFAAGKWGDQGRRCASCMSRRRKKSK